MQLWKNEIKFVAVHPALRDEVRRQNCTSAASQAESPLCGPSARQFKFGNSFAAFAFFHSTTVDLSPQL